MDRINHITHRVWSYVCLRPRLTDSKPGLLYPTETALDRVNLHHPFSTSGTPILQDIQNPFKVPLVVCGGGTISSFMASQAAGTVALGTAALGTVALGTAAPHSLERM